MCRVSKKRGKREKRCGALVQAALASLWWCQESQSAQSGCWCVRACIGLRGGACCVACVGARLGGLSSL